MPLSSASSSRPNNRPVSGRRCGSGFFSLDAQVFKSKGDGHHQSSHAPGNIKPWLNVLTGKLQSLKFTISSINAHGQFLIRFHIPQEILCRGLVVWMWLCHETLICHHITLKVAFRQLRLVRPTTSQERFFGGNGDRDREEAGRRGGTQNE